MAQKIDMKRNINGLTTSILKYTIQLLFIFCHSCLTIFLGQPLHADCFSCTTCKSSLRNVGHFVIGGQLFCQTHARDAQNALQGRRCRHIGFYVALELYKKICLHKKFESQSLQVRKLNCMCFSFYVFRLGLGFTGISAGLGNYVYRTHMVWQLN